MKPENLSAWMQRLGLSKSGACKELGLARSTLDRYLSPDCKKIPRYIELACEAVVMRWKIRLD